MDRLLRGNNIFIDMREIQAIEGVSSRHMYVWVRYCNNTLEVSFDSVDDALAAFEKWENYVNKGV
jgi:hypothetical protein